MLQKTTVIRVNKELWDELNWRAESKMGLSAQHMLNQILYEALFGVNTTKNGALPLVKEKKSLGKQPKEKKPILKHFLKLRVYNIERREFYWEKERVSKDFFIDALRQLQTAGIRMEQEDLMVEFMGSILFTEQGAAQLSLEQSTALDPMAEEAWLMHKRFQDECDNPNLNHQMKSENPTYLEDLAEEMRSV